MSLTAIVGTSSKKKISNMSTIDTKLYHDEESCKEPLFCGGCAETDGEFEPIPLVGI